MIRRFALLSAVILFVAPRPAEAVILQDPVTASPEDGFAWELYGAWQAFDQEMTGEWPAQQRCSPALSAVNGCDGNPYVESRAAYALEWRGRWSLAEGAGFELHVPGLFVQQDDPGNRLPPGVPPETIGLGDVRLVLARDLARDEDRGLVARLRANLPPNPSPLGLQPETCVLKDAQGVPVLGPDGREVPLLTRIEWAAPSVDLRLVGHQEIPDADLQMVGSVGANVPFRRQVTDTQVQWRGLAFEGAAGLTWRPVRVAALHLEALGSWSNPFEEDRRIICRTGVQRFDLAPGVTWRAFDGLDLWSLVRIPVWAAGYWRDWSAFDVMVGIRTSTWQP